jgi:hypothetical protein
MADIRGQKPLQYLFSVAPSDKLVYFVPQRIDELLSTEEPNWFTNRLCEALGPALRDPGIGFYRDIYLVDLAARTPAMLRLVDDTIGRIGGR